MNRALEDSTLEWIRCSYLVYDIESANKTVSPFTSTTLCTEGEHKLEQERADSEKAGAGPESTGRAQERKGASKDSALRENTQSADADSFFEVFLHTSTPPHFDTSTLRPFHHFYIISFDHFHFHHL